jgi:hypothetical protein
LLVVASAVIAALPAPASAGVYAGMTASTVSSDPDLDGIAAKSGSINGLLTDDPAAALRFFGGYTFLNNYLEVEGGYTTIDTISASVGSDFYDTDIEAFDITVLGHLPLFTIWGQKVSLYAGVGAYLWESESSLRTPGSFTRTDNDGTDLGYGGGLQVVLFNLVLLRAEFLKLDIDPADAGFGDITFGGVTMGMSLN